MSAVAISRPVESIGGGVRRNDNDVDRRYPGGSVDVFWDSTFTSSVAGVGAGRGAFRR